MMKETYIIFQMNKRREYLNNLEILINVQKESFDVLMQIDEILSKINEIDANIELITRLTQ